MAIHKISRGFSRGYPSVIRQLLLRLPGGFPWDYPGAIRGTSLIYPGDILRITWELSGGYPRVVLGLSSLSLGLSGVLWIPGSIWEKSLDCPDDVLRIDRVRLSGFIQGYPCELLGASARYFLGLPEYPGDIPRAIRRLTLGLSGGYSGVFVAYPGVL